MRKIFSTRFTQFFIKTNKKQHQIARMFSNSLNAISNISTHDCAVKLLEALEIRNTRNINYYIQALEHSSYLNRIHEKAVGDNDRERLEFLGDSILTTVVAEFLFLAHPQINADKLSMIKRNIVNNDNLLSCAREKGIDRFLRYDSNALKLSNNMLSDTVEAIIAALYLDQGIEVTKAFVNRILKLDLLYKNPADIECFVGSTTNAIIFDDPKGTLLCFIDQNKDIGTPKFEYTSDTKLKSDSSSNFICRVFLKGQLYATGAGASKKVADKFASLLTLQRLALERPGCFVKRTGEIILLESCINFTLNDHSAGYTSHV